MDTSHPTARAKPDFLHLNTKAATTVAWRASTARVRRSGQTVNIPEAGAYRIQESGEDERKNDLRRLELRDAHDLQTP